MQLHLSFLLLGGVAALGSGRGAGQHTEPGHAFPALPASREDPGQEDQIDDLTVYR